MKNATTILVLFLTLASLTGCKKGSKNKNTLLPNVTGNAGEIVLILPKELVNDSVGIAYKEILSADFPYLPQSEPLFDLAIVPPSGFSNVLKFHRNIIYNEITPKAGKCRFELKYDVWAAPQTVLYVVGPNYKAITRYIKDHANQLVSIFEQTERNRVVQNAIKYEEKSIAPILKEYFNLRLPVPKGFRLNMKRKNFVWISSETPKLSKGLIIYSFPFKDQNTFTAEYLTRKRDSVVRQIGGPSKGSYMITTKVIPPEFSSAKFKNHYLGILRGFWDVKHHPMGGPFISIARVTNDKSTVVVTEAYVYHPNGNKRNLLRQVEALIYSADFIEKPSEEKSE